MINFTNVTAALVLGVALAGASPALAAQRIHHPGHAARKAIQDCMGTSGKFSQSSWGNWQVQTYRSCMAGYGEVE